MVRGAPTTEKGGLTGSRVHLFFGSEGLSGLLTNPLFPAGSSMGSGHTLHRNLTAQRDIPGGPVRGGDCVWVTGVPADGCGGGPDLSRFVRGWTQPGRTEDSSGGIRLSAPGSPRRHAVVRRDWVVWVSSSSSDYVSPLRSWDLSPRDLVCTHRDGD